MKIRRKGKKGKKKCSGEAVYPYDSQGHQRLEAMNENENEREIMFEL